MRKLLICLSVAMGCCACGPQKYTVLIKWDGKTKYAKPSTSYSTGIDVGSSSSPFESSSKIDNIPLVKKIKDRLSGQASYTCDNNPTSEGGSVTFNLTPKAGKTLKWPDQYLTGNRSNVDS